MIGDKQRIRQLCINQRQIITISQLNHISNQVFENLAVAIDWPNFKRAHIYKNMAALKEIKTGRLIRWLAINWPTISITVGDTNRQSVTAGNYDLIIVPVLAFDKQLERLGWGGGWYDRFLIGQPQATKIGLAYHSSLVLSSLPHEPHDIRLDKIITEKIVF